MSAEAKEKEEKTEIRLVFLGAAGVGKTALIHRFLRDTFEPKHRRTVEELHRRQYRQSDAFALVYAVDDPESLQAVKRLQAEILAVKEDNEDASATTVELNWNHSVLEASAKDNANVAEVFWELLQQAQHRRGRRETFPKGAGDRPPMSKTNSCTVS
ncbi:hypothetical protein CRUP_014632 [Coryphaenoides rupestris]|nr:hypothetical protein CRUP_014632 [Coryphaenoides rupestris]